MSQAGAWNQSGLDVPSHQKTTQPDKLKHANWPPELNALQPTPNYLKSKQQAANQELIQDGSLMFVCSCVAAYASAEHVCKPEWPFAGRSLEPIWT